MCAVIGAYLKSPSPTDFTLLEMLFIESGIRGLHATGVSYIKDNKIVTIKEPVKSSKFVEMYNFEDMRNEDGNLYLIGHCRYSTSDLEYNQPFANEQVAIVHNGVISQEMPENWEGLYGYKTETRNDSELLLKSIEAGENPLSFWHDASISAIELHLDKRMVYYRNGKRPIHHTKVPNGVFVSSTADIVERTGFTSYALEVDKDLRITYDGDSYTEEQTLTDSEDLQHV